ncbi:Pathogenicity-related ORF2 [Neochlamydia sp. AcF65]|nr:Pathogenicity-related ORF2 [Neochlamydia sp. AcF65]
MRRRHRGMAKTKAIIKRLFSLNCLSWMLVLALLCMISPECWAQSSPPRSTTSIEAGKAVVRLGEKTPAEKELDIQFDNFRKPSLITQAAVLSLLAMLPFIVMILSSFMKIVVVLSLLRSALGVQQSPPNQVINGVAFMLSIYVMYPTALKMYDASMHVVNQQAAPESLISAGSSAYIIALVEAGREPLRDFLKRNSSVKHHALFYRMAYRVLPDNYRPTLKPDDFMILVPAYITSQLKDAFEIGVLIYIPFFVIDLVVSNVLLAMGMMMLSPVTISMPLKLFLLVMLDGWTMLIEGLVNTFR